MSEKQPHISLSYDELMLQCQDQLKFLADRCNAFDRGETNEAKRIAVTLRILLHDTRSSKSLLGQLNLKQRPYFESSQLPSEGGQQLMANVALAGRLAGNTIHRYSPHLGLPMLDQEIGFDAWWNQIVIVDKAGNEFSRKLIILSIADQDGGAHVDSELNEAYYKLTRLNSVEDSIVFVEGEPTAEKLYYANSVAPEVSPAFYTARQIAHEFLVSFLNYRQIAPIHRTLYVYDPNHYSGVSLLSAGIFYE